MTKINNANTSKINNIMVGKEELNPPSSINNNNFSTYTDSIYRYSIKYPFFNTGLAQPTSLKVANPKLRGEVFTLDNPLHYILSLHSTLTSPDVTVTVFHVNETEQMKHFHLLHSSGLKTFDINGVISNLKYLFPILNTILPNFSLLNKSEIMFQKHPAYTIEFKYFSPWKVSPWQTKVIYAILGDYLFIFEYEARQSDYFTFFPIFQKMINSFEFETNPINETKT